MKYFIGAFLVIFALQSKADFYIPDFAKIKQEKFDDFLRAHNIEPETSTAWSSPENLARKAEEDWFAIKARHPMQFEYEMADLWDKTYSYDNNGMLLTHYYDLEGKLLWSDHQIGTGSGLFQVNGMNSGGPWLVGDRGVIKHGTYTNYQCIIKDMIGITFLNDNSGLPVVFSGTALYLSNNTDCIFTGTGSPALAQGIQFTGTTNDAAFGYSGYQLRCMTDHILFHDMPNNPLLLNNSLGNRLYDGVNTTTKLLIQCNWSFCVAHKTGGLFGSFGGALGYFTNITDSCTVTHWTFDSLNTNQIITGNGLNRDTVSYTTINQTFPANPTADHGLFEFSGNISFHHNIRTGRNWGWCYRMFNQCLNSTADAYIYANINQGNYAYGFAEGRQDTVGFGSHWMGTPSLNNPRLFPSRIHVINNTVGNMANTNIYFTPIFISYGWRYAGYDPIVVKNLRYNSNNTNDGKPDSMNIVDFAGTNGHPIVWGNMYFANGLTALKDTSPSWAPITAGPVTGQPDPPGPPAYLAIASTDLNTKSFKTPRVVGAVEDINPCSNCAAYPRNAYPKNSP